MAVDVSQRGSVLHVSTVCVHVALCFSSFPVGVSLEETFAAPTHLLRNVVPTLNRELWGPIPDMCISYVHMAQCELDQTTDLPLCSSVYN